MKKVKSSMIWIFLLFCWIFPTIVNADACIDLCIMTGGGQICFDNCAGGGGGFGTTDSYGLPTGSIYKIVEGILKWLLAIIGIVAIIGFAVSGIMYLTSAGDEKKMGIAKNAMMYSIIGVIVGLSGFVVLQAVNLMLGGSSKF